jgi:hypothetical protein
MRADSAEQLLSSRSRRYPKSRFGVHGTSETAAGFILSIANHPTYVKDQHEEQRQSSKRQRTQPNNVHVVFCASAEDMSGSIRCAGEDIELPTCIPCYDIDVDSSPTPL